MSSRRKVLLAMSGGVDSSVAAALLLRQGFEVVGCFMRLGSVGESIDALERDDGGSETAAGRACRVSGEGRSLRIHQRGCCSVGDAADARLVAATLGIPLYVVNFRREFSRVIDYFVEEYDRGRTPNPCVRCNDWLKFGRLFDYADQLGAEMVATGHYARVESSPDGAVLKRGIDPDKDQSYVLFGLRRDRLERTVLPVGGFQKARIRALAAELGLSVSEKPDSQEICFVPDDDYATLVASRSRSGVREGPIVDLAGRALGRHPGHQHYTIGQRRGIGIAAAEPLYVVDKVADSNTVVVGPRQALGAISCRAGGCNWLTGNPSRHAWTSCMAQVRAHAEPVPAAARIDEDGTLEVRFMETPGAVAPGQAVVLYEGDMVLGGGWIERVERPAKATVA